MKLPSISIEGYKTIREARFEPGNLAVLIGPNGAGKSNLIAFFRLLSYLLNGDLRTHVGESGGASKLLHDGPQKTRQISVHIELETPQRHQRVCLPAGLRGWRYFHLPRREVSIFARGFFLACEVDEPGCGAQRVQTRGGGQRHSSINQGNVAKDHRPPVSQHIQNLTHEGAVAPE
ncbi:MAG: AAA family ATPase [Gemmatimonadaceae bacterium]|nr:AAA family ATPase [Gemmatimonadaceae bacterium]